MTSFLCLTLVDALFVEESSLALTGWTIVSKLLLSFALLSITSLFNLSEYSLLSELSNSFSICDWLLVFLSSWLVIIAGLSFVIFKSLRECSFIFLIWFSPLMCDSSLYCWLDLFLDFSRFSLSFCSTSSNVYVDRQASSFSIVSPLLIFFSFVFSLTVII